MKTLGEFIVEKQHEFSHATGELTALLSAIKLGAKIIHRDINKAGLVDILVPAVLRTCRARFSRNSTCSLMKLKAALKARDIVAGIASEEEDEIVVFEGCEHAKYVVLMDPWMARPTSMLTSLSVPFSPSTAALRLLARR